MGAADAINNLNNALLFNYQMKRQQAADERVNSLHNLQMRREQMALDEMDREVRDRDELRSALANASGSTRYVPDAAQPSPAMVASSGSLANLMTPQTFEGMQPKANPSVFNTPGGMVTDKPSPERIAFDFYRQRDPEKAMELHGKIMARAQTMLAFNPEQAVDYYNKSTGQNVQYAGTKDNFHYFGDGQGGYFRIQNKAGAQPERLSEGVPKPDPEVLMDKRFEQQRQLQDQRDAAAERRMEKQIAATDRRSANRSDYGNRGKLKPGERYTADGNIEAVPGSSEYIKQSNTHAKDKGALRSVNTQTSEAVRKIDEILGSPQFTKLFGGYNAYITSKMPGETQNARAKLESVKANLKKAGLELMRSGGSIGQMTEREWPIVEQTIANIDYRMSEAEARSELEKVKTYLTQIQRNANDTYSEEWGQTQFARGGAVPAPKSGGKGGATKNGKDISSFWK